VPSFSACPTTSFFVASISFSLNSSHTLEWIINLEEAVHFHLDPPNYPLTAQLTAASPTTTKALTNPFLVEFYEVFDCVLYDYLS